MHTNQSKASRLWDFCFLFSPSRYLPRGEEALSERTKKGKEEEGRGFRGLKIPPLGSQSQDEIKTPRGTVPSDFSFPQKEREIFFFPSSSLPLLLSSKIFSRNDHSSTPNLDSNNEQLINTARSSSHFILAAQRTNSIKSSCSNDAPSSFCFCPSSERKEKEKASKGESSCKGSISPEEREGSFSKSWDNGPRSKS